MEIISVKELDFGRLKVIEKECRGKNGCDFHLLDLEGFFDGFQEGKSGNIEFYLDEKLLPSINRVIFNIEGLDFFADVAYRIVKGGQRGRISNIKYFSSDSIVPTLKLAIRIKFFRDPAIDSV